MGRGTLLVGNGELMVPGGLSVGLLGHYQNLPLVLNDGERDLQVVQNRATGLLVRQLRPPAMAGAERPGSVRALATGG